MDGKKIYTTQINTINYIYFKDLRLHESIGSPSNARIFHHRSNQTMLVACSRDNCISGSRDNCWVRVTISETINLRKYLHEHEFVSLSEKS